MQRVHRSEQDAPGLSQHNGGIGQPMLQAGDERLQRLRLAPEGLLGRREVLEVSPKGVDLDAAPRQFP